MKTLAIRDKYIGFIINSRKKCIRKEFAKQIDNSKCKIILKALFIFANLLWIHYLFVEFIISLLPFFRSHYFFATKPWIHFLSREKIGQMIIVRRPLRTLNDQTEFSTKFWVKTFVYCIQLEKTARFDSF